MGHGDDVSFPVPKEANRPHSNQGPYPHVFPFLLFSPLFAAAQSLPEEVVDFDFDDSTSGALTAEPSRHEAPIPMERGLPFSEASLQPPSMLDPEDPAYRRPRANYIILDKKAYIDDRPSGTTALAFTLSGQAIQVSFCLSDPPHLSHLCVHCPELEAADFDTEPTVVCSEKDIAIVRIRFSPTGPNVNPVLRDQILYFVYICCCRRVKKDDARTVPIGTAILVHGLDACVTEKLLVYMFTPFGELSDLSFRANQPACAEEAMRRMNGSNLGRQKLAISWGSDTRDRQAKKSSVDIFNALFLSRVVA
ncbi:hypothetical protein HU200_023210 [Digitaria exilis]|uniref:RRM domain-containing protein n=1 Tax=Digitaria exilis TaxID=1010633 RepID=A0A835EWX3_9POAL|nr:hypothetical protein HU200_023210 [Digitaria exilis]